jgi:hypothetical protein
MSEAQKSLSRRMALAGAGTVGALAAVAALLPATKPVEAVAEAPKAAPEKGKGYQLTAHVQRYYDTTRV